MPRVCVLSSLTPVVNIASDRLTRGRQARSSQDRITRAWPVGHGLNGQFAHLIHDHFIMIHGYHLILPMYGFWLPNDPRGSWSDFVWKWELVRFGRARKTIGRRDMTELTEAERQQRDAARRALIYNPVSINGHQAVSIAKGFAYRVNRSNYSIWACAILPEHTHVVLARHTYHAEQMSKLLKAAATKRIVQDGRHPLAVHKRSDGTLPHMWAESHWKVYLDTEEQIDTAIRYVNENPNAEGKRRQHWSFVSPFRGLEPGHITYH